MTFSVCLLSRTALVPFAKASMAPSKSLLCSLYLKAMAFMWGLSDFSGP